MAKVYNKETGAVHWVRNDKDVMQAFKDSDKFTIDQGDLATLGDATNHSDTGKDAKWELAVVRHAEKVVQDEHAQIVGEKNTADEGEGKASSGSDANDTKSKNKILTDLEAQLESLKRLKTQQLERLAKLRLERKKATEPKKILPLQPDELASSVIKEFRSAFYREDYAGIAKGVQFVLEEDSIHLTACQDIVKVTFGFLDEDAKDRMALGGIPVVMKCLESNLENSIVVQKACWALGKLAMNNPKNQLLISGTTFKDTAGAGLCAIAESLEKHGSTSAVCQEVCYALFSLARGNAANRAKIRQICAAKDFAEVKAQHKENTVIQGCMSKLLLIFKGTSNASGASGKTAEEEAIADVQGDNFVVNAAVADSGAASDGQSSDGRFIITVGEGDEIQSNREVIEPGEEPEQRISYTMSYDVSTGEWATNFSIDLEAL